MASVSAKQFKDNQMLKGQEFIMVDKLYQNEKKDLCSQGLQTNKKSSVSTIQLAKKSVSNHNEKNSTNISTKRHTSIRNNEIPKDNNSIEIEKTGEEDTHRITINDKQPPTNRNDEIKILNDSQIHFSPELHTFQQNAYPQYDVIE